MDTVTLDITIDRPREEVFAYLSDVANHPEFSDHYLTDWHLTREDSEGRGAGARYKQGGRFDRFGYYDLSLAELEAPWRIIAVGRGGKYNRIKTFHEWTLEPVAGGGTRLEWTFEAEPALPTDDWMQSPTKTWTVGSHGEMLAAILGYSSKHLCQEVLRDGSKMGTAR